MKNKWTNPTKPPVFYKEQLPLQVKKQHFWDTREQRKMKFRKKTRILRTKWKRKLYNSNKK